MGNLSNKNKEDILLFLEKIKQQISMGKYDFIPRRKNLQSLAQYGLTIADVKDEIFSLVASDYYKGPKQDFDPLKPGDVWEFKKFIDGRKFYIKIKIVQINNKDIVRCLSFHEDEFA